MNNVHFLRDTLYQLKQNYGFPVTLIKTISEETNSETGQRTVQREIVNIKKAVDLPAETARKFWYDMAFLKANTNFTYGAEADVISKQIIIDFRDLQGKKITERDYIIYDHERYSIKKVYNLEHKLGYLLSLEAAEGALPYAPIDVFVQQSLQIYGEALGSL